MDRVQLMPTVTSFWEVENHPGNVTEVFDDLGWKYAFLLV